MGSTPLLIWIVDDSGPSMVTRRLPAAGNTLNGLGVHRYAVAHGAEFGRNNCCITFRNYISVYRHSGISCKGQLIPGSPYPALNKERSRCVAASFRWCFLGYCAIIRVHSSSYFRNHPDPEFIAQREDSSGGYARIVALVQRGEASTCGVE